MMSKLKKIPLLGPIVVFLKNQLMSTVIFTDSENYWINRYKHGRNSGAGSYNELAEFKANVINEFIRSKNIELIIDLGSGDGNQLTYFNLPSYIGCDISETVLDKCRIKFNNDKNKKFLHIKDISGYKADLVMSLDVIFHLVEDEIYTTYMNQLFDLSVRYVIIYSSNYESNDNFPPHIKHRKFSDWIKDNKPEFKLVEFIPNVYPYIKGKETSTSFSDFYIYEKI